MDIFQKVKRDLQLGKSSRQTRFIRGSRAMIGASIKHALWGMVRNPERVSHISW